MVLVGQFAVKWCLRPGKHPRCPMLGRAVDQWVFRTPSSTSGRVLLTQAMSIGVSICSPIPRSHQRVEAWRGEIRHSGFAQFAAAVAAIKGNPPPPTMRWGFLYER